MKSGGGAVDGSDDITSFDTGDIGGAVRDDIVYGEDVEFFPGSGDGEAAFFAEKSFLKSGIRLEVE